MLLYSNLQENAKKGKLCQVGIPCQDERPDRTPLNGIIGMADILEKQKLPENAAEGPGLLRHSTEVLSSIINDIVDFSKIESGKMVLDEIPFNLRKEINYCCDLALSNNQSLVKLNYSIDENVPDKVIGDLLRLRQILINFLNHPSKNTCKGIINLKCSLKESVSGVIKLGFELAVQAEALIRQP